MKKQTYSAPSMTVQKLAEENIIRTSVENLYQPSVGGKGIDHGSVFDEMFENAKDE